MKMGTHHAVLLRSLLSLAAIMECLTFRAPHLSIPHGQGLPICRKNTYNSLIPRMRRDQTVMLRGGWEELPNWARPLLVATILLSLELPMAPNMFSTSFASHAAVGSEEGRIVAEAWKVLDRAFYDPSFNGLDWRGVRRDYVGSRTYKGTKDAYAAVSEIASKLGDKYTRFLTPSQYQTLQNLYQQKVPAAGIGVEVYADASSGGAITVLSTVPNSPASKASIVKGDVIAKIDGQSVYGSADDAAVLMRGEQGTRVQISLGKGQGDLVLVRDKIKSRPVTWAHKEIDKRKVAVIKVPTFAQSTVNDVLNAAQEAKIQGIDAFIIDVRGNVGGSFPAGVDLAKLLLGPDKSIVFVVGRDSTPTEYRTEDEGLVSSIPLAILVDKNTASAAEVFAAALQDNGRAKLVGETTFGKGLVQTIAKLQDGSALVVTVAKYETPNHTDINKKGIVPDIKTDCPMDQDVECVPASAL